VEDKRRKIIRLPTARVQHTVATLAAYSIIHEIAQEIEDTLSAQITDHPEVISLYVAKERYLVRLEVLVDIAERSGGFAFLQLAQVLPEETPTASPSQTRQGLCESDISIERPDDPE
jgi:hypothetical protein